MEGEYIQNNWQGKGIKIDFYLIKGIIENLLNYLGFENRYNFIVENIPNMHPGMSAKILLDKEEIGIIGRIHPLLKKDDIYVSEISMTKLMKKVKPLKYKEPSKYPEVKKDLAFIVSKDVTSEMIEKVIQRAGGHILTDIDVFDVYTGDNVKENEKSIAFSLTFSDSTKTLTDEEVTNLFNKIINEVTSKIGAVLRDK